MTEAALLAADAPWRTWTRSEKARLRWRLATDLHPSDPRPEQLPPAGDWLVWLILAGRGWGKTRTGAETLTQWIEEAAEPYEWVVAAPTFRDVRQVCFEDPHSGLLAALTGERVHSWNRSTAELVCTNGARVYGVSADEPDRFRGKNLAGAWCDEPGAWRYDASWYEGLMPSLRIGARPRVIVTGTPKPTRLLLDLTGRTDGSVTVTRGTTFDNRRGLSDVALVELERRYAGTRIGRQELYGELLTDMPGAAWRGEDIVHVDELPELDRMVIAVDPAVTFGEDSDETGIIVAGIVGRTCYVTDDATLSPAQGRDAVSAMGAVVKLWHEVGGDARTDAVVIEANNGGDYLPGMLRTLDPAIPCRIVHATHGKAVRADPAAALYRDGRVHHVGVHQELEDQMTRWTSDAKWSPDRLDALVWALRALVPDAWERHAQRRLKVRSA